MSPLALRCGGEWGAPIGRSCMCATTPRCTKGRGGGQHLTRGRKAGTAPRASPPNLGAGGQRFSTNLTVRSREMDVRTMTLFRNMKRDGDLPFQGEGGLNVRPGVDVAAIHENETVEPGTGGMSTAPDDPKLLPVFRRPRSLGGTSKHPVWSVPRPHLTHHELGSRRDGATHELVEPLEKTSLAVFNAHVCATAPDWSLAHE